MDCIFCRIITGELPSYMVHQDDRTVCFLDIHPVNRGHCLVVPRKHFEFLDQMPPTLAGSLMESAARISSVLMRVLEADGFNLFLNNGIVAGQVVPHFHLHVVPRFRGDGIFVKAAHRTIPAAEMKAVRDLLLGWMQPG